MGTIYRLGRTKTACMLALTAVTVEIACPTAGRWISVRATGPFRVRSFRGASHRKVRILCSLRLGRGRCPRFGSYVMSTGRSYMETYPGLKDWVWCTKSKTFPGSQGVEVTSLALNRRTAEEAIALQYRVQRPNSAEAEQQLRSLQEQVEHLVALRHENVLEFFLCHVEKWQSLTLMSHNYGRKLRNLLDLFVIPVMLGKRLLQQILSGLVYLSEHKILVAINPRNVYLTRDGTIKIRVVLRDIRDSCSQPGIASCLEAVEMLGREMFASSTKAKDQFVAMCHAANDFEELASMLPSVHESTIGTPSIDGGISVPASPSSACDIPERAKRKRVVGMGEQVVGIVESKKKSIRKSFQLWRTEVLAKKAAIEDEQEAPNLECVNLVSDGEDDLPAAPEGSGNAAQEGSAESETSMHPTTAGSPPGSPPVNAAMDLDVDAERVSDVEMMEAMDGVAGTPTASENTGSDRDKEDDPSEANLQDQGDPSTSGPSNMNCNGHSSPSSSSAALGHVGLAGRRDKLKRKAAIEGDKRRRLSLQQYSTKSIEVPKIPPKRINIPAEMLKKCYRPEPNVYLERSCYDFIYLQTLLTPTPDALRRDVSKHKCGDYRKVLRYGTQYKVFVGKYGIHEGKGRGVVALESILKNKCVFEYSGELLAEAEATGVGEQYFFEIVEHQQDVDYMHYATYRLPNKSLPTIIDATNKGNASRFLNHSCIPNLEVVKDQEKIPTIMSEAGVFRIILRAVRDILEGEELTIDYHPTETRESLDQCAHMRKVACCCGSGDKCKRWIVVSGGGDDEDEDHEWGGGQ